MESQLKLHSIKTVLYCTVPDKLENTFRVSIDFTAFPFTKQLIIYIIKLFPHTQGYNARKVILEVYASIVLQCTVSAGNVNTRRMSKPAMGSIFHIKNQWNILVIGNYYANYQNYQNLMFLYSTDTKRTLNTDASIIVCKIRPARTGFNMYTEHTQLQLTFLAL